MANGDGKPTLKETAVEFGRSLKKAPGELARGVMSSYSAGKALVKNAGDSHSKGIDRAADAAGGVTRVIREEAAARAKQNLAKPDKYKKGGKVKKGGMALVHKGEHVLTAKQAKQPAIKKALKKKR